MTRAKLLGIAMIATPFVAMYIGAAMTLSPFQAATVIIVPWLFMGWLALAIKLIGPQ